MSIDKDSGLSQAELDALKDDDDLPGAGGDDDDDGDDAGGDDDDQDGDDDADGDDDQDGADAGDDDQDGDDDADADGDDDDAGADDGEDDHVRPSSDKAREANDRTREDEAKAKLADVDGKLSELDQKFEDGDITAKEYREEQKKLTAERDEAKEVLVEVKVSRTLREERAREAWEEAQDRFFSAAENKRFVNNKILFKALNEEVVSIARDPKNAGRNGDWVLAEAKKAVEEAFGAAPVAKDDKQGGKTANDKPARPQRPGKIPPDLGGLPAADTERPAEGRFAHLDKLSGAELEEAVGKMSATDQEAWARAS